MKIIDKGATAHIVCVKITCVLLLKKKRGEGMDSSEEKKRTHFRLDVRHQNIPVEVSVDGKKTKGKLKDISDGGIMFILDKRPTTNLVGSTANVSFSINNRLFTFDLLVIRTIEIERETCYSGKFQEITKLKKSQLSLLLMKLKLKDGESEDGSIE